MILRIWQEKLVIVTSVLSENGIESLFFLGFDGMLSSAVVAIINNIRKSYPFVSLLMWSLHLLTQTSAGHC